MKIGDPAELLAQLDKEALEKIQEQFGAIGRFLKPGDTFRFECDRSGRCCKNRFDSPIILSPYDVARLTKKLKIPSREFLRRYATLTLGAESQFPLALLKYDETSSRRNKCPFLRSYGCNVYQDRPLRFRLYPVGRAIGIDGKFYLFLMDVPSTCGLSKGGVYTIEGWLQESEVEPYLDWSDRFFEIIAIMNHQKYRSLDHRVKNTLGMMMYDFDTLIEKFVNSKTIEKPESDEEIMSIVLDALKVFIEKMVD
jgi:hypothetical protein